MFVPPHPLIKHWVSVLRNEQTPCPIFSEWQFMLVQFCTVSFSLVLFFFFFPLVIGMEKNETWIICVPQIKNVTKGQLTFRNTWPGWEFRCISLLVLIFSIFSHWRAASSFNYKIVPILAFLVEKLERMNWVDFYCRVNLVNGPTVGLPLPNS